MTEVARKNAVIVGGDALIKIMKNDVVMKEFLELSLNAEVVLCCRVSPK